jgi:hypothetical protein
MAMLFGNRAASARLAVLLPDAGAPTIKNIGVMVLSHFQPTPGVSFGK